jgi:outer membrane protein TolC
MMVSPRRDGPRRELELLEANARYYRESVALLRAKLYRRGEASSARLLELQRRLEHAERRLREYQRQHSSNPAGTPPQ